MAKTPAVCGADVGRQSSPTRTSLSDRSSQADAPAAAIGGPREEASSEEGCHGRAG
jgi:hypothetical protein